MYANGIKILSRISLYIFHTFTFHTDSFFCLAHFILRSTKDEIIFDLYLINLYITSRRCSVSKFILMIDVMIDFEQTKGLKLMKTSYESMGCFAWAKSSGRNRYTISHAMSFSSRNLFYNFFKLILII